MCHVLLPEHAHYFVFFLWSVSINYTSACHISVALFVITINTDFVINIPDMFISHARTQVIRSIRFSKTFDAHKTDRNLA